jgi:diguanylate cyclase (GGDEF)-like protein
MSHEQHGNLGAIQKPMDDVVIDMTDPETLLAEVRRLRAEIVDLEQRVELLDRLAHQDVLIDMPNRRGFLRQLEAAIDRVSRYDDTAAMLFIDLDGLKMINDTFGHQAGDQALIQVAEVLIAGIRKSDCVARLGGDEFAVLLERADEAKAVETAERLVSMITDCEFCFQGMCLPLSVAVGIAVVEPNDTPEACMARADHAMYREKSVAA